MNKTKRFCLKIAILALFFMVYSCEKSSEYDDTTYSLEIQFTDQNNVPVDASNTVMEMKYSSGPCRNNSTSFFLLVGEDTLLPSHSIKYGNYYLDGYNHLQIGIGRKFDSATTFFEYVDEKYLQQSLKIIILKPQDERVPPSFKIDSVKYIINGQLLHERQL